MRIGISTLWYLGLILLGSVAHAADEDAAKKDAEAAIEQFREQYASKDPEVRLRATLALRHHPHDLVVDEIGKRPLRDDDEKVRDVAAQVLGRLDKQADDGEVAERAGKVLTAHLLKNLQYPEVMLSIVRSIGRLRYLDAREHLEKFLTRYLREEKYRWVVIETIRTFGVMKDVRSLPYLLRLWEYEGKVKRGKAGPEVYSPEGAAKAKEEYERRYGDQADPYGGADSFEKWWLQQLRETVKILTGQEFHEPLEFRKWLKENRRRLGIDGPRRGED